MAIAGSAQLQSVIPLPLGEMTTQLISTAPPWIFTQAELKEATTAIVAKEIFMRREKAAKSRG
ncbi:MAG TPA: hypothetical protein VLC06_24455 [Polyangia bacterium]|nr:hypothetical protein [Polyangia bacterium]